MEWAERPSGRCRIGNRCNAYSGNGLTDTWFTLPMVSNHAVYIVQNLRLQRGLGAETSGVAIRSSVSTVRDQYRMHFSALPCDSRPAHFLIGQLIVALKKTRTSSFSNPLTQEGKKKASSSAQPGQLLGCALDQSYPGVIAHP